MRTDVFVRGTLPSVAAVLLTGVMLAAGAAAFAHGRDAGSGGRGPCDAYGYGMMGPGMMGHGAMGPGMMGYGAMGPGTMGYGAMGPYGWSALDLTDEQRGQINKIHDRLHHTHWDLMGKIFDERAQLRDLMDEERPDPKAVGETYAGIFDLRRQMIEAGVAAHNELLDVLTDEQREQLQTRREGSGPGAGYGWMHGRGGMQGYGPGMGHGHGPGMMDDDDDED